MSVTLIGRNSVICLLDASPSNISCMIDSDDENLT